jgi:hypothetical protein
MNFWERRSSIELISAAAGVGALIICAIAWFFDPYHALRGYLFAWLVMLGIALGSMCVVMLHVLTGGEWGWPIRKPAEAAAMTLPALLILFIPLALGLRHIYPWADARAIAESSVLQHRQIFFGVWKVLLRVLIYFALWIFWAWRLRLLSDRLDETGDPMVSAKLRFWSGSGFVMYFATMSLASMDWIASREVDWYSSTFGLLTVTGQSVTAVAFLIVVLAMLREAPGLKEIVELDRVHDLGNLLLTTVVLWSYIEFAQFLVIWMGNEQEDNLWFYHRTHRGWGWVGLAIILLHFAFPFVILLFQKIKRSLPLLAYVAGAVLGMRIIQVLWMVAPSNSDSQPRVVSWLDPIALIGVAGVWFACFLWVISRRPLAPSVLGRAGEEFSPNEQDTGTSRSLA